MSLQINESGIAKVTKVAMTIQNLTDNELHYLVSLLCDDYGNNVSSTFKAMKYLGNTPTDKINDRQLSGESIRSIAKHLDI